MNNIDLEERLIKFSVLIIGYPKQMLSNDVPHWNVNLKSLDAESKQMIIQEIEDDFEFAYNEGILKLPVEAKFGVYMAYRYYKRLLKKLNKVPSSQIIETRVRISDPMKLNLLARSYVKYKLNMI